MDNILRAAASEVGNRKTGTAGPFKLLAMVPPVSAALDAQFGTIPVSVRELTDAEVSDARRGSAPPATKTPPNAPNTACFIDPSPDKHSGKKI